MIYQNSRLTANEQLAPTPEFIVIEFNDDCLNEDNVVSNDSKGEMIDPLPTPDLKADLMKAGATVEELEDFLHYDFLKVIGRPMELTRHLNGKQMHDLRAYMLLDGLEIARDKLNHGAFYRFTGGMYEPHLKFKTMFTGNPFCLSVDFCEMLEATQGSLYDNFTYEERMDLKTHVHRVELCSTVEKEPLIVEVTEWHIKNMQMIIDLAEKYKDSETEVKPFDRSIKFLKVRNGRCKLLTLIRWWVNICNTFKNGLVRFDEKCYKKYVEGTKCKKIYAYQLSDFSEWSLDGFDNLIGVCYNVVGSTGLTSCMTKGDESTFGRNYYHTYPLHPFHAYMCEDWGLVFTSRLSYEEMLERFVANNRDERVGIQDTSSHFKGLFNGRAWTFLNDYYGKLELRNYWKVYGEADDIKFALENLKSETIEYRQDSDNLNVTVKMWVIDGGYYVLPYIDGDHQNVEINWSRQSQEGKDYYYATVSDEEYGEDLFKPDHLTGFAESCEDTVTCYITGDEIPRSYAVWISRLDEYVHEDYTCSGDLDAYAILEYYR